MSAQAGAPAEPALPAPLEPVVVVKRRVAEVRIPHAGRTMVLAGLVLLVVVVVSTRDLLFHSDEWVFIFRQHLTARAYFTPLNGHWSTVPTAVYGVLVRAFSLRTRVPEEMVMALTHVVAALLLFRVVRRRAGDAVAIAASLVFLGLGFGSEDIIVCCAGGATASVAFGLLAIDLLESRAELTWRVALAAIALILSLACSGFGLAFLALAIVQVALAPGRWPRLAALAAPVAAYLVWFALAGRQHLTGLLHVSGARVSAVAKFVAYGLASGGLAATGAGGHLHGWPVYLSLIALLGVVAYGCWKRIDTGVLGACAGLLVLFLAAGLLRAQQFSWFEASANRYMYVAVVFLILLVSAIVRRFAWTGALATVMVALVFVSLIGNAVEFKHEFNLVQRESVAEAVVLKTINAVRRAPDLKRRGVLPRLLGAATVQVGPLLIAERQFGQAVPRATLQALASSDPAIVDTVLRLVLARGLNVAATSSPHTCAAPPLRTFTLPSGGARVLVVNGDAKVQIELGWASTPEPARTVTLHTGAWKLRVPNIGMKRFTWRVVLNTTGGSVSAC